MPGCLHDLRQGPAKAMSNAAELFAALVLTTKFPLPGAALPSVRLGRAAISADYGSRLNGLQGSSLGEKTGTETLQLSPDQIPREALTRRRLTA